MARESRSEFDANTALRDAVLKKLMRADLTEDMLQRSRPYSEWIAINGEIKLQTVYPAGGRHIEPGITLWPAPIVSHLEA